MVERTIAKQVGGFAEILAERAKGIATFIPQEITHVYIKLDFKSESENAANANEAKGFLRSVCRASLTAHQIARRYNGVLLEVQGSTLHAGFAQQLQSSASVVDNANAFVADLHCAYRLLFSDKQKRVQGWRMTVDTGKTLIVASKGVHGDDSFVSLGNAANRPAKHLYSQLALPEASRELKVFHVGVRQPQTGKWVHGDLDRTTPRLLKEAHSIAAEAGRTEPKVNWGYRGKQITARALPLGRPGGAESPSPDEPAIHFGWVMRTDLDGFSIRVQECLEKNESLKELAEQFYYMMDTAAEFSQAHKEELAQLPWAGDNFTAAAVFSTKAGYDEAIPKRLIELALDFEKEMSQAALDCGTSGWAYGIAGGGVHENSSGNVFLAGIEIDGRRFLIGVGEGFGRSTQAFGDIDPHVKEIVLYKPDWEKLQESYKEAFEPAVTVRGQESTLYRAGKADALGKARLRLATLAVGNRVTLPAGPAIIHTKPHSA